MKKEYTTPGLIAWGNVKDLTLGGPVGNVADQNGKGFNNRGSGAI